MFTAYLERFVVYQSTLKRLSHGEYMIVLRDGTWVKSSRETYVAAEQLPVFAGLEFGYTWRDD